MSHLSFYVSILLNYEVYVKTKLTTACVFAVMLMTVAIFLISYVSFRYFWSYEQEKKAVITAQKEEVDRV